jgi:hypothetical protein
VGASCGVEEIEISAHLSAMNAMHVTRGGLTEIAATGRKIVEGDSEWREHARSRIGQKMAANRE